MDLSYYLKCMQIEHWHLRQSQSNMLPECYQYCLGPAAQPVGVLWAEKRLDNAAEATLVAAMVKAMQIPYQLGSDVPASVKVIVLLGEQLASTWLQQPLVLETARAQIIQHQQQVVVVSYAPQQLLANPALKVFAWQDIKMAMRALRDL